MRSISGGEAVVLALQQSGVDHAFCVPGESFLGILDALFATPKIRVVTTRHESGAGFMAEAWAKISGRPAVCMASRMPGAANLSIAIHTAMQDRTPMIAIIGQVTSARRHRGAFQEAEFAQMFAGLAKWAVEVPTARRLADIVHQAASIAMSSPMGPVVIAVREDELVEPVPVPRFGHVTTLPVSLGAAPAESVFRALRGARTPAMLVGAGVRAAEGLELAVRLSETEEIPAFAAWRQPDSFPNEHRLYLGQVGFGASPNVRERIEAADILLVLGTRLDEVTTFGYVATNSETHVIHVDLSTERSIDLAGYTAIQGDIQIFLRSILELAEANPISPTTRQGRALSNADQHAAWLHARATHAFSPSDSMVDLGRAISGISDALPIGAVTTTDAGSFGAYVTRYLACPASGRFVGPLSGAMGYGIPAAVGSKLAKPESSVVALAGDGGFLMTAAEIETAVREHAPFTCIVFDNRSYASIAHHQQRLYPDRPIATSLGPVDFARLAQSLGAIGVRVHSVAALTDALTDTFSAGLPAVIHVPVDPLQSLVIGTDGGSL